MDIVFGWTIFIVAFLVIWLITPQEIKEEVMVRTNKQFSAPVAALIQQVQRFKRRRVPMVPGIVQVRSRKTRRVSVYKNKSGVAFHEGDTVKLTLKAFQTHDPSAPLFAGRPVRKGKIVSLFTDIPGLVLVEPKLGGFHTWDVNDLRKVK